MTLATDIDYLPREVYRGKWIVIHQNYRPPARKTHVYAIYSKSGDMKTLPQHNLKCRFCPWTTRHWKGKGRAGYHHLVDHVRKQHGDEWIKIEKWIEREVVE